MTAVPLDPLTVPLWGSRLIEASAGTGKTWTIAALYLRLVLGHGIDDVESEDRTAFTRALMPHEILVMTFTIAATRELVDRIRTRLASAARCFRGDEAVDPTDTFLASLLETYTETSATTRATAAHRLASAAEAMDDAAVLTIDAWVQRMLREHAFDSGSAFDETLQPDDRPMLAAAVQDYWRMEVYPLRGRSLDDVLAVWPTVASLTTDMHDLLAYDDDDDEEPRSLHALLQQLDAETVPRVAALKTGWRERAQAMRDWMTPLIAAGAFKKNMVDAEAAVQWLDGLERWSRSAELVTLDIGRGRHRLTRDGIGKALRKGWAVDPPAAFDAFAALIDDLDALPDRPAVIRRHAMRRVSARLAALKRRAATYHFQDMLERLERALLGPNGDALRDLVVGQYPVALIDEFQDTSPVQYRIFDRLYGVARNDRDTALFLIGDPKQSIYGFRGADIGSYLRAARAMGERRYPLTTNYRSTVPLVEAMNRLFVRAEERPGDGAFRFRGSDGFDDPLPFVVTQARGRDEVLVDGDGIVPALTLVHDATLRSRNDAHELIAGHCAERIAVLLSDPRAGLASNGSFQRLEAGDIAVLVRSRTEATTIRKALQARSVRSVYLSDSESIFRTAEARDVLHWLRAVADPDDARLARAALAARTMGLSFDALASLHADDAGLERVLDDMRELHGIWRRQGVLPMLRAFLHRHALPSRWLAGDGGDREGDDLRIDGERRLTNVLHLAELLQTASAGLEGEQALIRWLVLHVHLDEAPGDEEIVRLESDADLVQVMTIHVAKGLEYGMVFLPFGTSYRASDKRTFAVDDDDGRRVVRFDVDEEEQRRVEREQQQEAMRVFYVALTRAEHALWVGVPSMPHGNSAKCSFDRSPLGHLVAGEPVKEDAIDGLLREVFAGLSQVRVETVASAAPRTRLVARDEHRPMRTVPTYDARFERDWSIGSFSAFVRDLERGGPASPIGSALIDPAVEEELRTGPVELDVPVASQAARHRFPRGAFVGSFLHDQLEWLAERRFAMTDDVRRALVDRCTRQGWGRRASDVATWLGEVVTTPLRPIGIALDALPRTLPEMEFWLPSDGIAADAIDALCRDAFLAGRDRPPLPPQTLRGMLMGFADLTFEHEGRYWVIDYKSNALGTRDADYTSDAIEAAMAAHRYDVQAAIYLLALHRLLRVRLGDRYDPDRHVGGAIDLFLRGIKGPVAGCRALVPPPGLLDALDALVGLPSPSEWSTS